VRQGDEMLSLDLAEVSQCVLPGNNRNEIELQFPESDAVEANNDQLVSIRFYIPPDQDNDPADRSVKSSAELLQQKIMSTADIRKTTGDIIVEFDHEKGSFLTPRGRYSIELCKYYRTKQHCSSNACSYATYLSHILVYLYLHCLSDDRFFRMRGQKYDYKIKYDDISRLFLLPKPDDVHMAFVIALDKPIRQGQQRYQHLVLQTSKDPDEVTVNLDEETLKKEYGDDLQPVMRGSFSNLVAKTFKVIAKKKVFIPGKFSNANQQSCVKCALRANEGLLYPLEKQFVFIHKPPVLIRFNEVESVEFQRYAGGQGSTRNFDLAVMLKASAASGTTSQEYIFSGIDRSDYQGLYSFLSSKNISIKNLEEAHEEVPTAPVYNEDEIYGGPDEDAGEESEDESYDEKAAAQDDEGSGSEVSDGDEDLDDDEFGDEIDDDLDSDLEEARGSGKTKKFKAKAKSGDDDDDDDMIVDDTPKKKRKKSSKKSGDDSPTKKKAKKDPNAPKKALSSYMIYMSQNRARVKEKNPEASFGDLARLVSKEFKALSPEEKKKYEDKVSLMGVISEEAVRRMKWAKIFTIAFLRFATTRLRKIRSDI
jgi:structure-specific recognition protein 1